MRPMVMFPVNLLAFTVAVASGDNCQISEDRRTDCQYMKEGDCRAAGCCWNPINPNPNNRPWCFVSDGKVKQCKLAGDPQAPFSPSELDEIRAYFAANLDIQGSGMVTAATGRDTGPGGGDYFFDWMRDEALCMNAYMETVTSFADAEAKMDTWLAWVEKSQKQHDPNGVDILVEPKFEIPDGTPYTGGWCRPQTDGPGLRAITLMAFASKKPSIAQRSWELVKIQLDWVAANYTSDSCDLWEEVQSGDFFWNRYTMRKALKQGAKFASRMGDTSRAAAYAATADTITKALSDHVTPSGFVFESSNREEDSAVIEAFNVGDMNDGMFEPLSKEVVATLIGLSHTFCSAFELNSNAAAAGVPGVLFGRYAGDNYAGGNPWVLLSASAATLLYRQAKSAAQGGTPDAAVAREFAELLGRNVTAHNLLGAGDAIMLLMKKSFTNGMHMNEQIDRNTGALLSATDLTWNYANVLKAMKARDAATKAMRRRWWLPNFLI